MREIFEILAAMLAAYGLWTLLRAFRDRLLYPKRVRQSVNAAVYIDNGCSDLEEISAYVKYLERDGKSSRGRLILVAKGDIIKDIPDSNEFGLIADEEDKDGHS